ETTFHSSSLFLAWRFLWCTRKKVTSKGLLEFPRWGKRLRPAGPVYPSNDEPSALLYTSVALCGIFGGVKFVSVFGCVRVRVAFAAKPLHSLFSEATYRIEGRRGTIFLTLVIRGCQNPGIEVQR